MQDSNLYSMQLRPQNMDQYIRSVDPVFSITRDDNSIFFNELQSVCQTIPDNYLNTGAKNRLVTAVLASRDGQENKFEGMQRILKEKAKEQLGIDIDFYKTSTGEPITKLFINEQMGFSDTFPASAVEYIDALIYYAAGSLFDSLAESPFNTAQSQEELSILMQFFLAEINIYCKTHHISADNFGKILDENRALSAGIAAVVKHALSRQLSVEKELCRFINTRINDFHLTKPLSTEDIKNIEENFAEHYAVIKNSPHFDEFTIFDTNQPGKFVTHQGSICTNLSEFIGEGYPDMDNSFFAEIRREFQSINGVVPHNNEFVHISGELDASKRKEAVISGFPLGFVMANIPSQEQIALISALKEEITSIVKNKNQLEHITSYLSSEAKTVLGEILMQKLPEIICSKETISLADLSAIQSGLTPAQIILVQNIKQLIDEFSKVYPENMVRVFASAVIGGDDEEIRKNINLFQEYHSINSPELILILQLDPTWPSKINAAVGQVVIEDKPESVVEKKVTEADKANHAMLFRSVLNDMTNRNVVEDISTSTNKKK